MVSVLVGQKHGTDIVQRGCYLLRSGSQGLVGDAVVDEN
jgi:hypothetical protein